MSKISELSDGGSLLPTDFLIAVRSGGNVKVQADQTEFDRIRLGDNEKIELGNSQDLQIYHDGSNSYIDDAGDNRLYIRGSRITFDKYTGETMADMVPDGAVNLFYNNTNVFQTTATGINTGTATMDALTVSGIINTDLQSSSAWTTNTRALEITTYGAVSSNDSLGNVSLTSNAYESGNGTWSRVAATSAARYQIDYQGNSTWSSAIASVGDSAISWLNRMKIASNGDISFYEDTGTTPKLFWDATDERLGLGLTNPSQLLHLKSSNADTYIQLGNNTVNVGYIGYSSAGALNFWTSASTRAMTIDSSSNVGIGTVAPSANTEIRGSASNGVLRLGGSTTATYANIYSDNDGVLVLGADAGNNAANSYFGVEVDGAERMRIDGASGNVGINTTSLDATLTVNGGSDNLVGMFESSDTLSYISFKDSNTTSNTSVALGASGDNFTVYTGSSFGTEAMRISGGNLLVGQSSTTTPGTGNTTAGISLRGGDGAIHASRDGNRALYVNRNTTDGPIISVEAEGVEVGSIGTGGGDLNIGTGDTRIRFNDATDNLIPLNASNGYRDAAISLGDSSARFKDLYLSGNANVKGDGASLLTQLSLANASTDVASGSSIDFQTGSGPTTTSRITSAYSSANKTELIFSTYNSGLTESMRISDGNLLVGTTSSLSFGAGTTEGVMLERNAIVASRANVASLYLQRSSSVGQIANFYQDTSSVGNISVTGTATTYNTSSDQRLKDNIVDAPSASDDIDAIQVRSFDWKADGSHQKYGMVAQELQTVAPEAVSAPEDPDEMMGVDYSKLVPMLIKEIQQLRQRVAQLED